MGLRINNNIPALNASRQAGTAAQGLQQALEGMATGLRINRKMYSDFTGRTHVPGHRCERRRRNGLLGTHADHSPS